MAGGQVERVGHTTPGAAGRGPKDPAKALLHKAFLGKKFGTS